METAVHAGITGRRSQISSQSQSADVDDSDVASSAAPSAAVRLVSDISVHASRCCSRLHWRYVSDDKSSSSSSLLFSSLRGRQPLDCLALRPPIGPNALPPDKPVGYWNLLVVFANLKRVIQCACFKSLGSGKGTPKCNLRILAVAQHLPRKWRLVSSSSLQRGHNGSLTLRIIVRCRLRVLCPPESKISQQTKLWLI